MNPARKKTNFAFIDSQNLNVGTQKYGWKMDWKKFRQFLRDKYGVEKAFMFIGYVPEFEPMYEQLHEAGYMIVLKPTFDLSRPRMADSKQQTADGQKTKEDERPTKGNIDADLVLWAMKEMSNYNKAVLVSGDGDFYSLVEYLEKKERLLKILTPNAQYSQLFNRYDKYIERLDQHRKILTYPHGKKRVIKAQ